jgi:hypothetical protein
MLKKHLADINQLALITQLKHYKNTAYFMAAN